MAQEVIEITEREIEIIEVIERGPVGPQGPQPDINYEVVSSARTLEAADLIAADTSGGAFTLTLPANPSNGDAVDIFDFSETFDTNPLTIARNGQPIESLNEDLVANVEGAYFTLIYTGSTRGWQVLPRYGTSGGGGESALTTQGDMLYRGVGINTRLPIGSAGQILKVNSGATAPEWGAAPATGVTSVGVSGSDGIEVDSGSPITGSGTIALGVNAASLRSHINVADGANNYTHPNHSGEVTSSGDGATTIANDVVTNAKLANVATATIKGRATAGTGDPEDLSAGQVRTILNVADGAEVNVQSNWTEADSGSDAFILNKPTLGGAAALNVGTTTGTVCAGDDARLSDSRTPTSHAASHASAGSDPLFDQNLNTSDSVVFNGLQVYTAASPTVAKQVLLADDEGTIVGITGNEADARASLGLGDSATADIGTGSTEVAAGDHGHGNITNAGLVGTTANLPLKTGTGGIVEAGAFGVNAGEFAEGNHTHTQLHDKSHSMTDATSHTAGNHKVFYSDGSGQIQELALGNSGEVLTSNGATSAPSFAAASGGIGGGTGSVDNALLRADGTGGATAQASNLVIGDEVRSFTGVTGDASTDIITVTGSGFSNGQRVRFTALTGGSGLNTTTNYFVINASGDTFQVSTTEGGSFVNFTTNITAGTLINGHFTQVHTQISNTGADTNIPLVVTPKGTGAFILGPPPDNTTTGGNARGANAIDLQQQRDSAAKVASGQRSFVSGESNRASGSSSFVAGGLQNVASASPSFATGASSTASGYAAAAFAGATASGNGSFATGSLVVADRSYMVAFGGGRFGANTGSAQRAFLTLFERTTTDSAAELLTGSDAQGLRRRFTIPSGEAIGATIQIVGTTSENETANYYLRQCLIRNRDGTTELVGSVQTIGTDITGVTVGGITISASDANDALVIEATGYTPVTGCTADAGTDVISKTAHGFSNNDDIVFTSLTGGAGLTVSTVTYWVIDATADTFKVSATRGGAAVNITTNYTDMTATRVIRWVANIHATEVIAGITGHS